MKSPSILSLVVCGLQCLVACDSGVNPSDIDAGPVDATPTDTSVDATLNASPVDAAAAHTPSVPPSEIVYLKSSNTNEHDSFGRVIAVSGDTMVIGAPNESGSSVGINGDQSTNTDESDTSHEESGAVYVFRRTGATWEQEAYIKASTLGVHHHFGASVALSEDLLIVGSPGRDHWSPNPEHTLIPGGVYVFRRSGTAWTQDAYLEASNAENGDLFGASVAVNSTTVAVGAPGEDSNARGVGGAEDNNTIYSSGAVYVFEVTNGTWEQDAYIKASNTPATNWNHGRDGFGTSVALSGLTLAIGAPFESEGSSGINGNQDTEIRYVHSGAVYIFRRDNQSWAQEAYVKANPGQAYDMGTAGGYSPLGENFGISLALDDDTLVVGAPRQNETDDDYGRHTGAAYVFRYSNQMWAQEARLSASNVGNGWEYCSVTLACNPKWGFKGQHFGESVAIRANRILVGSPGEGNAGIGINDFQKGVFTTLSGAAYSFLRTDSTWEQDNYLKASNPWQSDAFGGAVAISVDSIVVATTFEDSRATGIDGDQSDNSARDSGAVYVFH